uniref:Uncharacterized protein n=1 Tax=Tanacetum cinerariifolium TaxID=118510 RepID=A0A699GMP3_TANCI|nr:hypothetical protein [Tanacetum cinerariifolium]
MIEENTRGSCNEGDLMKARCRLKRYDESSNLGYAADAKRARDDKVFDNKNAVRPLFDNNTLTKVHHSNNDTFENVFALEILNHEQLEVENYTKVNREADKLQKPGQTAQTFHMFLSKEDNVNTGKQGLGFKNQNDVENPFILNKAKELTPSLYNIDEMGKDLPFDYKIMSEEELKCEAEKHLKVKQRKSPLSYHGFVYSDT